MPELPTHQELYDEAKAEVSGDPNTQLTDFSPGSMLDAAAGVAATIGRAVQRWMVRQMRRAFLSTAPDGDLEFKAVDMFGGELSRRGGESLEDYRERVIEYRDHGLRRGVPESLGWYAESIDGVTGAVVRPDDWTGVTEVIVWLADEADEDDVRDAFFGELGEWRSLGGPVNLSFSDEQPPERDPNIMQMA